MTHIFTDNTLSIGNTPLVKLNRILGNAGATVLAKIEGRNPAYSASKGAVVSLTRSLAVAFAKHGVRVNAVAPGWIETRMSTNAFSDPERATPILNRIPAARWGKPAEVAKAVAFLGSADAGYITGVVLPVDGGYSVA